MVHDEPNVILTSRYDTKEACTLLGITRKTLLRYTKYGTIKCGYRKATMKRFYTGLAILKFWQEQV